MATATWKRAFSFFTGLPVAKPYDARLFRVPRKHAKTLLTERDLLTMESQIGAQIFGPVPDGHARQFFCLDESTWIWSDSYTDDGGRHETLIRYEIHETAVLKVLGNTSYGFLGGDELRRFVTAVQMYYERVSRDLYKRDPQSGQKIA